MNVKFLCSSGWTGSFSCLTPKALPGNEIDISSDASYARGFSSGRANKHINYRGALFIDRCDGRDILIEVDPTCQFFIADLEHLHIFQRYLIPLAERKIFIILNESDSLNKLLRELDYRLKEDPSITRCYRKTMTPSEHERCEHMEAYVTLYSETGENITGENFIIQMLNMSASDLNDCSSRKPCNNARLVTDRDFNLKLVNYPDILKIIDQIEFDKKKQLQLVVQKIEATNESETLVKNLKEAIFLKHYSSLFRDLEKATSAFTSSFKNLKENICKLVNQEQLTNPVEAQQYNQIMLELAQLDQIMPSLIPVNFKKKHLDRFIEKLANLYFAENTNKMLACLPKRYGGATKKIFIDIAQRELFELATDMEGMQNSLRGRTHKTPYDNKDLIQKYIEELPPEQESPYMDKLLITGVFGSLFLNYKHDSDKASFLDKHESHFDNIRKYGREMTFVLNQLIEKLNPDSVYLQSQATIL